VGEKRGAEERLPDRRLRERLLVAIVLVALAPFLVLLVAGCGTAKQSGRLEVAVSIVPLADFTREVGGDLVEVETLVPPGASPHTFEPTAGQLAFLSRAKVFVTSGLQLETWAADVFSKVGNKGVVKVVAADAIPRDMLLKTSEADAGGPYDPHVWLDPTLAIHQVNAIARGLAKADPAHAGTYRDNAAAYGRKLKDLDSRLASETATFTKKSFVALHPAWSYFARRYGLVEAGAIEEVPSKEPSGELISKLVDEIKKQGITVVFAEPQINPKAAEVVAQEGGAKVKFIDPLGNPDKPDVSTYIKLMQHNVAVMAEVLK
jgi:zinc transport system substrate-binding protein